LANALIGRAAASNPDIDADIIEVGGQGHSKYRTGEEAYAQESGIPGGEGTGPPLCQQNNLEKADGN